MIRSDENHLPHLRIFERSAKHGSKPRSLSVLSGFITYAAGPGSSERRASWKDHEWKGKRHADEEGKEEWNPVQTRLASFAAIKRPEKHQWVSRGNVGLIQSV